MQHLFFKLIAVFSYLLLFAVQAENLDSEKRFKLHSGDLMPLVGFGTAGVRGEELVNKVLDLVLAAGYRQFDSATLYRNEEDIGKALKLLLPKYNLTRKDIFITTKLAPADHGEQAYAALENSLKRLDCEYIDLYLIHWPGILGLNRSDEEHAKRRSESWKQLVRGVNNGLTRNIGVSNYNVRHLKELLANDHGVKPAVNQVEWHPFCHQQALLDFCNKEGILLEAYSSLGGTGVKDLLENKIIKEIATKLEKSPAQVLLRWSLQKNIAIIPKATSKKHIEENIALNFVIPDEDMQVLNSFNQRRFSWNPDEVA